ncbi:YceI-like domain-containing protein [Solimonas aquatica]|uniref:YceI-like domain-containing protein n=2 Tax=Solimonas aquatica TaxID=489703 RepID=A0A1H9JGQ5_9GAMM|nr:YceI-like domain-containing protein [Solimonas aquatica]
MLSHMHPKISLCAPLLLAAALCACQSNAPREGQRPPAQPYRENLGSGTLYMLDPSASKTLIYVFRGGAAASRGHNHVLNAPSFEGRVLLAGEEAAKASFSLCFRFDQLQLDWDALRSSVGGNFSTPRSEQDIADTRRNMLKSLDAGQYPELVINSVRIAGDWPVLIADVDVSLHGVSHRQTVMLKVQHSDDQLVADGQLVLRQSDFGIKPLSVLGGLLAVQDEIAVEFELVGNRIGN